jgi:hypothetical protein
VPICDSDVGNGYKCVYVIQNDLRFVGNGYEPLYVIQNDYIL